MIRSLKLFIQEDKFLSFLSSFFLEQTKFFNLLLASGGAWERVSIPADILSPFSRSFFASPSLRILLILFRVLVRRKSLVLFFAREKWRVWWYCDLLGSYNALVWIGLVGGVGVSRKYNRSCFFLLFFLSVQNYFGDRTKRKLFEGIIH